MFGARKTYFVNLLPLVCIVSEKNRRKYYCSTAFCFNDPHVLLSNKKCHLFLILIDLFAILNDYFVC